MVPACKFGHLAHDWFKKSGVTFLPIPDIADTTAPPSAAAVRAAIDRALLEASISVPLPGNIFEFSEFQKSVGIVMGSSLF